MKGEKAFEVGAKGAFHMIDFKGEELFLIVEILKMPRPCDRSVAEVRVLYSNKDWKNSSWSVGNKTIFCLNDLERLHGEE